MATFNLEIVTPTEVLQKDNISYLRCPGADGLFGVLAGHRDALIALSPW
jgi:F-type H+-transporting ATPase subunit epsilon